MDWNTGVLAGGTVLLALALGGLRGLVVVMALTVSWGVLRLISIAGAAHDEKRSEECHAQRGEAERKAEQQQRQAPQRPQQAEQECDQRDEMNAAERQRAWVQAQQQREAEWHWEEAQRREAERNAEQERQAQQRWRQAEQEREAERRHQRQSERAAKQSEESEWWTVLEVLPHASADEIRRAYRRKIKQCHPDRVAWLAPELLELAEIQTRTLNAAYGEANRARRSGSEAR